MKYDSVKKSIDQIQTKTEIMLRDEFIIQNVKKALKINKGERPIEILITYDQNGIEINRIEQFWIPTQQDIESNKWIKL